MIKVLLFAPTPPSVGGIANWTGMLLKEFSNSDEVNIKAINVGTRKKASYDLNLVQRVVWGLDDCKNVIKEAKQIIKNEKIDIIHFTSTGSLSLYRDRKIIRFAKKNGIPIVMHIRVGRFIEVFNKKGLEYSIFKKNFSLVDKIITIDKNTYECVSNLYPQKAIEILNPIDFKKRKFLDNNIIHNNLIITYVGWVIKTKGIEELIKAFTILRERYPSLILRIIGPYSEEYMEHILNTYDTTNIEFLGKQSNEQCLKYIQKSSAFVFPSYTEGCPNVVLEAMLCETPVIASNVGSIPELLNDNCGIVIKKESITDIVDNVTQLLDNQVLSDMIVKNAYNKIVNELSIEKVSKKYLSLWKSVLNERL